MTREIGDILSASSYTPTCKIFGKVCDSHYAYCHHVDIDHGYDLGRKYEYDRALWQLQNKNKSKGVRLK